MDLKTYFFDLTPDARDAFSARCETSTGHLQNIAYGYRLASTELAVAIERESGGKVTRIEMFPDTYWKKWPELAATKAQHAGH